VGVVFAHLAVNSFGSLPDLLHMVSNVHNVLMSLGSRTVALRVRDKCRWKEYLIPILDRFLLLAFARVQVRVRVRGV